MNKSIFVTIIAFLFLGFFSCSQDTGLPKETIQTKEILQTKETGQTNETMQSKRTKLTNETRQPKPNDSILVKSIITDKNCWHCYTLTDDKKYDSILLGDWCTPHHAL